MRRNLLCVLTLCTNFVLADSSNTNTQQTESPVTNIPIATIQTIRAQSAISDQYDQRQEEIAAEEDYMDGIGDGMYGYPFMYMPPVPVYSQPITNNTQTTSPQMVSYYESQMSNGDVVFNQ